MGTACVELIEEVVDSHAEVVPRLRKVEPEAVVVVVDVACVVSRVVKCKLL